ncbi:hypothetical protein EGM88_09300 [Aureibaculum marinum]|uniref:TonB C-terminal domain-containing protein n=1 Tax=Aureibaculum marinum TaxID=2487930 RepID=A0A3N4PAL8_9FLAO|nr:hypothetical protein [Aureibaculum marinum]RPD96553.1 hypothetical protein EGM88_09300 [Aureibaculum marinum]
MKKLSVFIVMLFLGTLMVFPTNVKNDLNPDLTIQIREMLKSPDFINSKEELNATVFLTLNSNNEIVIIQVDSEEEQVENFVKSRLNYKKVKSHTSIQGKIFKMPLKIIAQK